MKFISMMIIAAESSHQPAQSLAAFIHIRPWVKAAGLAQLVEQVALGSLNRFRQLQTEAKQEIGRGRAFEGPAFAA